jgi:hypothetical protein
MRLLAPGVSGFAEYLRLAAASAYKVPELRDVARMWWERALPADFRPAATRSARPRSRPLPARPHHPHRPR